MQSGWALGMVSEKITQSIGLVVRSPRQPASEQLRLAYKITRIRSVPLYQLMIPPNRDNSPPFNRSIPAPNPAIPAPFNPAIPAPNPAIPAPFNPARIAPQQSHSLEQSKEQKQQQRARPRTRAREAHENQTAAAAAPDSSTNPTDKRHVCPQCTHTWPKQFGAICFKCQCDVELDHRREEWVAEIIEADNCLVEAAPPVKPPVSATAMRLLYAMGGTLPESWLNHQDLKTLIGNRDFREVSETIVGIGSHKLPAPQQFFEDYNRHLQEHKRGEAELKALCLTPQPANNGTNGTRRAA